MSSSRFPPQFLRDLKQRINLALLLPDRKLEPRQGRLYALCPLHLESSPSFSIDPTHGVWYCHGCQAGGDLIDLVMRLHQLTFREAVARLADDAGIPLPTTTIELAPRTDLPAAAARHYSTFLNRSLDYLSHRLPGTTPADLSAFHVGFAPGGTLARTGLADTAALEAAGLLTKSKTGRSYEAMTGRITFPLEDIHRTIQGLIGRAVSDSLEPRYRITHGAHRSTLFFGLAAAAARLAHTRRLILVEGPLDALACRFAVGEACAVATLGALTEPQARALVTLQPEAEILLAYDGDPAGETIALKALRNLLLQGAVDVKTASFPTGSDPASIFAESGPAALRDCLDAAQDSLLMRVTQLRDAARNTNQKSRAATAAAELLTCLSSRPATLHYYRAAAASILDLPPEHLL